MTREQIISTFRQIKGLLAGLPEPIGEPSDLSAMDDILEGLDSLAIDLLCDIDFLEEEQGIDIPISPDGMPGEVA